MADVELYDPWRVEPVPCWLVLIVTVYHRNIHEDGRFSSASEWGIYHEYMVERWDEVIRFWDDFYKTCGYANRFALCVERWQWTVENRWEPHDYM